MDLSINMLMKIALVLITILLVAAAFTTLFQEGGDQLTEENSKTTNNLDCVTNNPDSALEDCKNPTSFELVEEAEINEV